MSIDARKAQIFGMLLLYVKIEKVPIEIESTPGEMNLNLNNFVIWVVGDWPPSVFSVLCALAVILLLDSRVLVCFEQAGRLDIGREGLTTCTRSEARSRSLFTLFGGS